ncbi:MAG: glycoside hydrolase family 92 protein [Ruminococcaceae bacterium]|nr:glycoside hydrolase family 92 protein [Oscillospiraceae bacterium]
MSKVKYIDPMIGTVGDEQEHSFHGGGKTHPGACFPFGMVQLSPDTTTSGDNGTGYNYCQNTIEGFSFNHMSGIGWYGDLGNLQVMPIVGKTDLRSGSNREVPFTKGTEGWRSPFSHANETAKAGYYSVRLDRYDIVCEATVSCHTGMLRFTYPQRKESGIIFNFSRRIAGRSNAQKIAMDGNFVSGCITCDHAFGGFGRGEGKIDYKLYFCLELSKQPKCARFFENEEFCSPDLKTVCGEDVHLLVNFETEPNEPILIRCGISYVDAEGARNNLACECPNFDFDAQLNRVTRAWEDALCCAEAEGSDETDMTLFYTCLYHALLDPRTAVDADGRYRDPNGEIHKAAYTHRTMFSGWDVYRSEFPLLTLISPKTVNDEVNSLLNIALAKNSSLPRWELMGIDSGCMVGDPGMIVMADAYLKGIRDFDIEKAYDIAFASATAAKELYGKPFKNLHPVLEQYQTHAYVPNELSDTLEFLLADYTLSQLALRLGKTEDHTYFLNRANSFVKNFNKELGFMAPRDENGDFLSVKDRYDTLGCVESNIYQQSMFVPYHVDGLAQLFGKDRLLQLLEELFEKADLGALWNENYNHSNEPCHNLTHYFTVLGKPERTQYWTRRVQKESYRLGVFGFCGNEDVGQLSAWYVLSAMGFAQVCMADDKYYINTPLFPKITVKLDPRYHSCEISDTLTLICDKDPLEYPYIEQVCLNGKRIDRTYLTYGELTSGGILEFYLTNG